MKTVDLIKVFIASPGDILSERNEVEELIWQWNNEHTDSRKVILMPIRWEKNSTASYRQDRDGQGVINEQLLDDSDILLAIFGNKIGSKTRNGQSGTIEEIEYFHKKNSRGVGVFFIEKDNIPKELISGYEEVQNYKKQLEMLDKGLHSTFETNRIRLFLTREVDELIVSKSNSIPNKVNVRNSLNASTVISALDALDVSNKINILNNSPVTNPLNGTIKKNDGIALNPFSNEADLTFKSVDKDESILLKDVDFDGDEQLLLIFIVESEIRDLGARWKAEETTEQIKKWEEKNKLNNYLSDNYESTLSKLEQKKLINPKEYTGYGNVRLYSIDLNVYKKLKMAININSERIKKVKEKNTLPEKPITKFELPF